MTHEEYKAKMDDLFKEFELKKKNLAKEYATSNRSHNIGDIITSDHLMESIKIDSIVTYLNYDSPQNLYRGFLVKKDGTPFKNNKRSEILQNRIIKPNN